MIAAIRRFKNVFAIAALGMVVSLAAVDFAEARRAGGGLGSRGTRTHTAAPATNTAPGQAAPINRSMTERPAGQQPGAATQQNAARPNAAQPQQNRGMFGGMMGGLMGGLLMGGLLGMLMGGGFGGMAGMFGMILQMALIGGGIWLAMRFFASRRQQQQPAYGSAGNNRNAGPAPTNFRDMMGGNNSNAGNNASSAAGSSFKIPSIGSKLGAPVAAAPAAAEAVSNGDEIGVTGDDLNTFQGMLQGVQTAYANENYAELRKLCTPEAMSYLAEELSDNATSGVKNDVSEVTLLQGDVAEAWNEGDKDYATVAMRYSSIDVMRDRATGAIVEGNENEVSESVELWTFVRTNGGEWLVSAIQDAR
jgi:predicted lipid-binding transport protein (Tim44 family)